MPSIGGAREETGVDDREYTAVDSLSPRPGVIDPVSTPGDDTQVTSHDPLPRLRIGSKLLAPLLRANTSSSVTMADNLGSAELEPSLLVEPDVEYLGESAIEAVTPDGRVHPLFTGVVDTVEIGDDAARVTLVGFERELSEIRIGGIATASVHPVELIYCLLRLSGVPDDRMKLDGWTGSDPDVFLVVAPVDGISTESARSVLDVTITPENPARLLVEHGELRQQFVDASCWVSTTISAGSLFEAEILGLDAIDDALAALHALCSYSYSTLQGDLRPYRRDRARLCPRRAKCVFTGSLTADRQWLRSTSDTVSRPNLTVDAEALELGGIPRDARLRRALREWRNAATSDSEFVTVTHLWRAVEVYAHGASADPAFGRTEIDTVKAALASIGGLSDFQRRRLKDLAAGLNDAPLFARLKAALDRDGIAVSDGEMDLLRTTRNLRNALEHARELTPLEARRLAQAVGVVNRILVSATRPA